MPNDATQWIAMAALAVSVGVALIGYFRKPAFISVGAVEGLRLENTDLRRQNIDLHAEVSFLKSQVAGLLQEREFWQEQYRQSEARNRRV